MTQEDISNVYASAIESKIGATINSHLTKKRKEPDSLPNSTRS